MTASSPDARAEAARLLRQRLEMGEAELFLDGMDRARALGIARALTSPSPGGGRPGEPGALAASGRPPGPAAAAPADPSGGGRPPASDPPPEAGTADRRGEPAAAAAAMSRPAPPQPGTAQPGTASPRPDPASGGAERKGESRALPVLPDDYEALRALALGCTRCGLSESRTQVVFSDGVEHARVMVVGEAPGANEDETGLPFVGAAGQYLDLLLATVDLSRKESVYICNVLKCRPPGNRNPEPGEIEACSPYLLKQIEIIRPEAILAVGSFAGKLLTGSDKSTLGKLRGTVHSYQGVPLVVTYHPAALLRNANWTRAFWDDLQLLRDVLDGTA